MSSPGQQGRRWGCRSVWTSRRPRTPSARLLGAGHAPHDALDIEGALLFPGDALRDEDGYAVRSGMVQTRTTFFF